MAAAGDAKNARPATIAQEEPISVQMGPMTPIGQTSAAAKSKSTPADVLFTAVRVEIIQLLKTPMKNAEVAAALDVSNSQAKVWLQRLVEEDTLEKLSKPARYVVRAQKSLLNSEVQKLGKSSHC